MTIRNGDQKAPPPTVVVAALIVMVLVGGWLMLRFNTSYASRECSAQYRLAKTAADTARVDRLVPHKGAVIPASAFSCGFTRSSARWR